MFPKVRPVTGQYDCTHPGSRGKSIALEQLKGMSGWSLGSIECSTNYRSVTVSVRTFHHGPDAEILMTLHALIQGRMLQTVWITDSEDFTELTVLFLYE